MSNAIIFIRPNLNISNKYFFRQNARFILILLFAQPNKRKYNQNMTIYIEEFLIQNIIINFCLLKLIHSTTKPTTSFFRMLIASVLGAGFSVLSAIYISNSHAMNILKILCAITMVTLAFKQTIKNRISSLLLLLIYTYALCGVVTTICGTSYATTFGMVISCKINMNYVCLIITFASYIFDMIARHLSFKFKQTNYHFNMKQTS